jgi:hypothetical protein
VFFERKLWKRFLWTLIFFRQWSTCMLNLIFTRDITHTNIYYVVWNNIPYDQLFRSKKLLRFWTYVKIFLRFRRSDAWKYFWLHICICFNLYLEIFAESRSNCKQATALYVQYPLLKTSLWINAESFMFRSKNHFCVKIWLIVTVVWRLLVKDSRDLKNLTLSKS